MHDSDRKRFRHEYLRIAQAALIVFCFLLRLSCISTLTPHSGTRRDRVALFGLVISFFSTGTSTVAAQNTCNVIGCVMLELCGKYGVTCHSVTF